MGSKRMVNPRALAWRVMRRRVAAAGEVPAQVVVVHIVGEHVPHRGQDGMLEGDDRFLFAQSWRFMQNPVLTSQRLSFRS